MADADSSKQVTVPGLVEVVATQVSPPPGWALLERRLMALMEEAVRPMVDKYAEKGGAFYFADDVDDLYERVYNWGLFYAMGADRQVLDLALQQWNATTRFFADDIVSRVHPRFSPQIHNEYYNQGSPGANEWHHQGEGNMAFYHFGLADPTISENVRRSRRFAAMFLNEDPEAPNYDPRHKIFRSPMQTSVGPMRHASVDNAIMWLQGGIASIGEVSRYYGVRATLYPVVENLEPDWFENPERRDGILKLFDDIVLNGDVANSLGATALVTNAYLYTGEDKYRQWVLEYTEAWMERMRRNGGIMPDNVGPTGKIGENRRGQWWGGLYGWNSFVGYNIMFNSLTIAAECAVLLTGDFGYLELLRSQIRVLMENAITREDGQLLLPARYGPRRLGVRPGRSRQEKAGSVPHAGIGPPLSHLHGRRRLRPHRQNTGDRQRARLEPRACRRRKELRRHRAGPLPVLRRQEPRLAHQYPAGRVRERPVRFRVDPERNPRCPGPDRRQLLPSQSGFHQGVDAGDHGGAALRVHRRPLARDPALLRSGPRRPGLPPDVAALVDKLGAGNAGVHLVNLNTSETRNLIVQAGAFAEHRFVELTCGDRTIPVESKYFASGSLPLHPSGWTWSCAALYTDPPTPFPGGEEIPVPYH